MRIMALAAIASVAGCTPYQAMGVRGGYDEDRRAGNTWAINVEVNFWTSRQTAILYSYRRASELCPGGFDILHTDTDSTWPGFVLAVPILVVFALAITRHSTVSLVRCQGEPYRPPSPPPPKPPEPPAPPPTGFCFTKAPTNGGAPVIDCSKTMGQCRARLDKPGLLWSAASDCEERK